MHSHFVENKKHGGSQHQGELQDTMQGGSQQDAAIARSNDQVAIAESGWVSKELMDLIKAVP